MNLSYSKRWNLVHLLGGKCVDCSHENFSELEIDHIKNDGDGERKYYSSLDKKHLLNPNRAKEMLEIRCKKCHEKRHHPQPIIYGREIAIRTYKNGVMEKHGTLLGNVDGVIICELYPDDPHKIKQILRDVRI